MIPLLITMDLEVAFDHDLNEQKAILTSLCCDMKKMGIPLTVFSTSEAVDFFTQEIKMLRDCGNEIGCHGFNHSIEENYKQMSCSKIEKYISDSTKNIEAAITEKPVCFRGPGMATSSDTQDILIKYGYNSDYSVCSQRLDFFNPMGGTVKWINSPRYPYHPSEKDPYKKGKMPIWVIPLSCIGIPFLSGILYLFGLSFMKHYFNILLREAAKTGKPIVYLFHSYEFSSKTFINEGAALNRKKHKLIHRLYGNDPVKHYEMTLALLRYMLTFNSVLPITGRNYTSLLGKVN